MLLHFTVLRRSEVLGLRWDAIDFEEKAITIRHTVNETRIDGKYTLVLADTTKTKSSYRTLPLVAPFEAILKRLKAEQEENRKLCGNCYCQDYLGYIYVNELGELIKPGYLSSHVPVVLKEHNMPPIRFHDLRHSCASLLFSQGVSLKEIQAWLGHSTIGTTANIYTHLDENSKINSANAIIGILEQKRTLRAFHLRVSAPKNGAANGNRTRTVFGPRDFKSLVSTSSTMAAYETTGKNDITHFPGSQAL